MPTPTHSLFLTILADHLNQRPTVMPAEFDESALIQCAQMQQCAGIVYFQTHLPSLHRAFAGTNFYAVNRRALLRSIHTAFSENHIPYLLFKGTEIARFYPEPALRTMGDSDILVRLEDKKRASDVLLSLGFGGDTSKDGEWLFRKGNLTFELHHRLLYDESVNLSILKDWTDSVWDYSASEDGIKYSIEPEYNFVYLMIHLRKHLMNQGVGFRQFMDLAVTAKQPLDWDRVNGYLDVLGLTEFASNCLSVCSRWFDIALPLTAEISDGFFEAATEKIFAGGVFGFSDQDNQGNSISFQLQRSSRLKVFFRNIFLPYSHMRGLLGFSYVDGRPWLLPVAWVHRIFRILKERRTKSAVRNMFAPLTIPDEKISDRENYLRQWGL